MIWPFCWGPGDPIPVIRPTLPVTIRLTRTTWPSCWARGARVRPGAATTWSRLARSAIRPMAQLATTAARPSRPQATVASRTPNPAATTTPVRMQYASTIRSVARPSGTAFVQVRLPSSAPVYATFSATRLAALARGIAAQPMARPAAMTRPAVWPCAHKIRSAATPSGTACVRKRPQLSATSAISLRPVPLITPLAHRAGGIPLLAVGFQQTE